MTAYYDNLLTPLQRSRSFASLRCRRAYARLRRRERLARPQHSNRNDNAECVTQNRSQMR
jgi:hypothetical protein